MKVLKYYPKTTFGDATYALVAASDSSTLSVYTHKEVTSFHIAMSLVNTYYNYGLKVFKIEKAHEGMIRGLCVWEVRDGLNLRNIILTAGD